MFTVKVISILIAVWAGPTLVVARISDIKEPQEKAVMAEDYFDDSYSFERYVAKFHKKYNSAKEYNHRHAIFQKNLQTIVSHNTNNKNNGVSQFTMGINHFTDQLPGELPLGYDKSLKAAYNSRHPATLGAHSELHDVVPLPQDLLLHHIDKKDLPTSVDWRRRSFTSGGSVGVVTPVKNQGGCGSCWAFAATAALESHIALATGKLFVFSVQEFVSCVPNVKSCGGGGGCSGSTAELAYDFVATYGMVTEWNFGYQSYHGAKVNCTILDNDDDNDASFLTVDSPSEALLRRRLPQGNDQDKKHKVSTGAVASIVGFANLPMNSYDVMLTAVATVGPVVVNVAANNWGTYSHGIFNDDDEPTRDVNHAVVLEGYGTDEATGQDYWLIRNSWGPLWGEDGYIRLKRVDPSTLEDPDSICKMDTTPADGIACTKDDNGDNVVPPPVKVCGTSAVLYDGVIPVGGHLL